MQTVFKSQWVFFFNFFRFFHVADQATDVGAIIEFYLLWQKDSKKCSDIYDIDARALFYASLFAFCFYKIISAIAIWILTKHIWKTIRQLADFEIYRKEKKLQKTFIQLHLSLGFWFFGKKIGFFKKKNWVSRLDEHGRILPENTTCEYYL